MVHHAYAAVRHSSTGTTIKGCTCPTPLQIETTRSLLVICYWSGVLLLLPGSTDAASRAMSCSVAGRAMVRTATASIVAFILVSAARRAASSAVTPDGGGGVGSNWGLHAAASASVAVRPDGVAEVGPYFSRSASSAACARTFDAAATPVT